MWLAEVSIRRPVFAVMLIAAIVALGWISLGRLGVDLFPNVRVPGRHRHDAARGRRAGDHRERDHRDRRGARQHHRRHPQPDLDQLGGRLAGLRPVRARGGRRRRRPGRARQGGARPPRPAARRRAADGREARPRRGADPLGDDRGRPAGPRAHALRRRRREGAPPARDRAWARSRASAGASARSGSGSTRGRLRGYGSPSTTWCTPCAPSTPRSRAAAWRPAGAPPSSRSRPAARSSRSPSSASSWLPSATARARSASATWRASRTGSRTSAPTPSSTGVPGVSLEVRRQSGRNTVEVARAVRGEVEALRARRRRRACGSRWRATSRASSRRRRATWRATWCSAACSGGRGHLRLPAQRPLHADRAAAIPALGDRAPSSCSTRWASR